MVSGKSGPDYIDPAFHAAASGRECVTLDGWAFGVEALHGHAACAPNEIRIIEGAMGLFDGPVGSQKDARDPVQGSTAHLASSLNLPVVLVLDARRMGQSAAAIVSGLNSWTSGVEIAGVILNRVASPRHAGMLQPGIERICPVLAVLPEDPRLSMPSRHLGLVQASEMDGLETFLDGAADVLEDHCDLDALLALVQSFASEDATPGLKPLGQRTAIAQDVAFAFAYPHLLSDWRNTGAELSFFSPLADEAPDAQCDAVFLPGGYPELHAGLLASGTSFLPGLRDAAARGALIYGECGGFMVLGDVLIDADGTPHKMAGLLSLQTSFAKRKRHLGYRRLTPLGGPWDVPLAAHEFHYSTVVDAKGPALFKATDAADSTLPDMGLIQGSVMGSYAHVISTKAD